MKLPSLNEIVDSTTQVLKRFPLAITSAFILAVLLLILVEHSHWVEAGACFSAVLGIPLFIGIDLLSERRGSKTLRLVLSALGIVGLVVYALVVGDKPEENLAVIYRFSLLVLAVHLFVAIAPFIRAGSLYAFWEFNKTLFLRALLSALFSAVLFGGLAVAMLAVDQLLLGGETIKEEAYLRLFIVIGTLFNTFFFLAGVPRDFAQLEEEREYPKGLKIFAQNLLLPLVVLYMLILYVYAGSILIKWEWPKGWIGWLVLSFSVLGVLALLLLHPLQKREDIGWIRRFTRWFYVAVLPLIGLLFAAIIRRIAEYGITENRYFVVLLACWLAGMALYFIFSRRKNIKVIPASLCIAAVLAAYGPWSAATISTASQAGRFRELAEKNSILTDGKVDPEKSVQLSEEDRSKMWSILDYLSERSEVEEIADLLPEGTNAHEGTGVLADAMGINSTWRGLAPGQRPFSYSFSAPELREVLVVRGFDLMVRGNQWSEKEENVFRQIDSVESGGRSYRLLFRALNPALIVVQESDTLVRFDIASSLARRIDEENEKQESVPSDGVYRAQPVEPQGPDLIVEGVGGSAMGQLRITSISGAGAYTAKPGQHTVPTTLGVGNMSFVLLLGGLPSVEDTP